MAIERGLVFVGIAGGLFYSTVAEGRLTSQRTHCRIEDPSFQGESGSTEYHLESMCYMSRPSKEVDELQQVMDSFPLSSRKDDEGSGSSLRASLSPSLLPYPLPRCAPLFFFRYDHHPQNLLDRENYRV